MVEYRNTKTLTATSTPSQLLGPSDDDPTPAFVWGRESGQIPEEAWGGASSGGGRRTGLVVRVDLSSSPAGEEVRIIDAANEAAAKAVLTYLPGELVEDLLDFPAGPPRLWLVADDSQEVRVTMGVKR